MAAKILNTSSPTPTETTPPETTPQEQPAITLSPLAVATPATKRAPVITKDGDITRIDY